MKGDYERMRLELRDGRARAEAAEVKARREFFAGTDASPLPKDYGQFPARSEKLVAAFAAALDGMVMAGSGPSLMVEFRL